MSRLIDADELLKKKMCARIWEGTIYETTTRVVTVGFINSAPTIDPEELRPRGWKKVSECPPPDDLDWFLAISRFNAKVFIAIRRPWGERDWIVGGKLISKDIRYWMPMPDVPEELKHEANKVLLL